LQIYDIWIYNIYDIWCCIINYDMLLNRNYIYVHHIQFQEWDVCVSIFIMRRIGRFLFLIEFLWHRFGVIFLCFGVVFLSFGVVFLVSNYGMRLGFGCALCF
jgi:membrane-bound ClpP family serine protease